MKPQRGDTFMLTNAFKEKGPVPAAVLSVTMQGSTGGAAVPAATSDDDCEGDQVSVCEDSGEVESECSNDAEAIEPTVAPAAESQLPVCGSAGGSTGGSAGGGGSNGTSENPVPASSPGAEGTACSANSGCATGLACFASVCQPPTVL